jgi:hypothetical protein
VKRSFLVILTLVMVLAMTIGSANIVSAGKPEPYLKVSGELVIYDDAGIYDTPGLVYIDCSLEWKNIGAWGYKVEWGPTATNATLYSDIAGGKKLRKLQTTLKLRIPEETIQDQYTISVTLLDRRGSSIGYSNADTVWPSAMMIVTTAIFAEHFTKVANYSLPYGWSTNRTDLCYALNNDYAGGVPSELVIRYDDTLGTYNYSDYWVSTYEIETTVASSNLTLSFDHSLDLWVDAEEAYPYTIVVEVSANNGTAWNATSFVDSPTWTEYPSGVLGPEKVYVDLSSYAGQAIVIRWRIYGYTYMMNEWEIDNVVLTGY